MDSTNQPPKVLKRQVSDYMSSEYDTSEDEAVRLAQEQYSKDDPTLNFFWQPHTISILVGLLLFGLYIALFSRDDSNNFAGDVKWGLTAASVVFVIVGTVLLKDGPFSRPHPAVWRAVLAISILYELFLVFLLFLDVDDARQLFKHINPTLGVPLPERSYAEHCEFTFENVLGGSDEFVAAHVIGWWAKTMVMRDVWLTWILSVMFEIMEYSLEHQLPNFAECWWDHWILDVLICNWLGIYLGMKTLKYLETKTYDWRGWNKIPSKKAKAKRALAQFTPESWTVFEWGATKNLKRWLAVIALLVIFLQVELNAFYLKFILWFPPTEPLNSYRLLLHFAAGLVGMRETYRYLVDPKCKRLGSQCWMCFAIIQTETLLSIKWGRGMFPAPAPAHVVWGWTIFIVILFLFTLVRFSPLKKFLGVRDPQKSKPVKME